MNNSRVTKQFYDWELRLKVPWHLERWCRVPVLRKLAQRIWARERPGTPCPKILLDRVYGTSYYDGNAHVIAFSPKQQSLWILLHELAHAMTPKWALTHGPSFVRTYKRLLRKYGKVKITGFAV